MPLSRKKMMILGGIAAALIITLLFVAGLKPEDLTKRVITLTFWGVFDEPSAINAAIQAAVDGGYGQFDIKYQKFSEEAYESALVNALAAGRGPDIFMVHNTWLPKHFDKLYPMPAETMPIAELREAFPTVVEQDFAPDGVIYALPLYIDTLAFIYNQSLFDSRGIAEPPRTWAELERMVPRLKELEPATGQIKRAAIAIGGSNRNVNRATDVLNLLMLQSGVKMVQGGAPAFARDGIAPLAFYVKFANSADPAYTWNPNLPNSIDGFVDENVGAILNYAYQLPAIKARNPFLSVAVAPLPQPQAAVYEVNYANYWGIGVSNLTRDPEGAWRFIKAFAADPDVNRAYLAQAGHPPALRSLIRETQNDPELGVFARQALSARSWPQADNSLVEEAFSDAIDAVLSGRLSPEKALRQAEDAIGTLMKRQSGSL